MTTNTIVVIAVAAVVALLLLSAALWLARTKRNQHRHTEAEAIRGHAREEDRQVQQREALADETAARARVAQAEADIKTAQAKGLQQRAAGHRKDAVTSRDDLNDQFERADALDPSTPAATHVSATRDDSPTTTGSR